jgi:shikimate kinase
MRIYLIGFMGSGKTALGQKLAGLLQYQFIDLDEVFERQYKITIFDFFHKYGEDVFRKLEQKVLRESINMTDVVISTGGGTPCFFDNMDFINQHGVSVFLSLPMAVTLERLRHSRKPRPLLEDKNSEELVSHLAQLMEIRLPFYQQAHLTIEEQSMQSDLLAVKVVDELRKKGIV